MVVSVVVGLLLAADVEDDTVILASPPFDASVAAAACYAAAADALNSPRSARPPAAVAANIPPPVPIPSIHLFGGAPLATTLSPLSDGSDLDFGSSYEGPQGPSLALATNPDSVFVASYGSPSFCGSFGGAALLASSPSARRLPSIDQQIEQRSTTESTAGNGSNHQRQQQPGPQMKSYSSPVVGEGAWLGGAPAGGSSGGGGGGLPSISAPSGGSSSQQQQQLSSPTVGDAPSQSSSPLAFNHHHYQQTPHQHSLGTNLHPRHLAYGTSPGGQSDLSNEAQIHGSSTSSQERLEVSPPGHQDYTPALRQHQQQHLHSRLHADDLDPSVQGYAHLSASHGAEPGDHGLHHAPFRMSGIDQSDGRPSIQSVRSAANDTSPLGAPRSPTTHHDVAEAGGAGVGLGAFATTPSAGDSSSTSRAGQSSGVGGGMSSSAAGGTPTAMTSSTSFADSSYGTVGSAAGVVGGNGMIHAPATLSGSASGLGPAMDEAVPTSFDEGMLRALCDMDVGMPLLFDRIKQSMVSAREAATFLKKRAAIEEEYARNLMKLSRSTLETYSMSDAKAGTFVSSWQSMMKTHDSVADNRIRFASKLTEMSDELNNLAREVDKSRKQTKETGLRLEKNLTDAEAGVEKARARFDATAEDLERLLLLKSGESTKGGELAPGGKRTLGKAIGKSGLLFKNKNPQQILKQEEEIRNRTSSASDAFRKEVLSTQGIRQEYFNLQLPRILRSLKESAEEIDNGTQYHLARYAFLYESTLLNDGMSISPVGNDAGAAIGLKAAVEAIDNRSDFKSYMQNYQVVHASTYKGPRREGPYEEGFLPSVTSPTVGTSQAKASQPRAAPSRPIFGVDLADQMTRDGVDVPPILEKCAEAIESHGLTSMGIYRLSGTTSKVQRLKAKFNEDWESVNLAADDEALGDINIVAGCLKLWFRELPEPLLTHELYSGFIEAAKVENERLRHIRLHERVNELPDANYATLKFLMAHLDRIKAEDHINQMSASNLAIVFGPTLLSPPPSSSTAGTDANGAAGGGGGGGMHLQDMSFQCRAVETILEKYREIFVDENEE